MGILTRQAPEPRKGMPSPRLGEQEFKQQFLDQFVDPAFAQLQGELAKLATAAWEVYVDSRKAPRTQKAGPEFADPEYDLAVDWIVARAAIKEAERRYADRDAPSRVLLINCSSRSEHTCPGEMSKSWRLVQIAREVLDAENGFEVDLLDLSRLASEYGRNIYPCKACFSTSPALCHWPCSCYPNYSLGQTHDWMNDIYPMWVAAHGIMIVTPVNWYQTSSPLKLMMDRMVCADGGNPDPTRTDGKDARKAKEIELRRLGLSSSPGRKTILGRGARRRGGCGECAPLDLGLALLHAPLPGRPARRARPLHWLLEAILNKPRRARSGRGTARGGSQRRASASAGGHCKARRHAG